MRILSHTLSASFLGLLVLSGCAKDASDDGGDDTSTPDVIDNDGDGVPAEEDCDDANADLGAIAEDADCDGTLTADDCDDADAASTIVAEDGDCDGTLTADDCDDDDATSTIVADDADCDGVLTGDDCDDTLGTVQLCGTCQDALDSGFATTSAYVPLDLDGDGSSETVLCDQETHGGGWTRCAWIDYVANISTTSYDAGGNVIASNSEGSSLGTGGTQAIKSACFDLVDEVGFGVTHAVGGSEGGPYDFEYWGTVSAPVIGSDVFAFTATGGSSYTCSNATEVDITWLSYPDGLPRLFLFGADNGTIHNCQVNGAPSGSTYGIWSQFETTTVANSWVELSNTHFDRLGTRTSGGETKQDGVLEFWVR
jgi:hypothetical protein